MMESEVNRFETSVNMPPMKVDSFNPAIGSTLETAEILPSFEEVKQIRQSLYERKRKIRRVRSGGIF